ncbi:uncharacterized protein [Antedon mediterranea]|uniref:uncharacterized protein n=1 Tax=Antedon mediterranea TaxID=105859 RepID=UPI003AF7C5CD
MRRHLKIYVETVLFPDAETRPAVTNTAYYPQDQTLRNHIYTSLMALRYSKLDQENLKQQMEEWQKQHPLDNYFLRLASAEPTKEFYVNEDDDELIPAESSQSSSAFFFAHQTEFQRHLLNRYGTNLCFLDATYKTTRYALPLFFLAVKTNVGYSVVGEFVVQMETKAAILEGLSTIKQFMQQANLSWNPTNFLTDFCERELSAIKELFPETKTYICDFHREQAWIRWVSKTDNGVTKSKDQILAHLRRCAHATTVLAYKKAVNTLKMSEVWKKNCRLQQWLSKKWLPHCELWAWSYRKDQGLQAHTNNGLERQNRVFKHKFLVDRASFSISGMISALHNEYLPSRKMKYITANVKADDTYGRTYKQEVPHYLQNRPPAFLSHCLSRFESSQEILSKDITRIDKDKFKVKSQSLQGQSSYLVDMSPSAMSVCECIDWLKLRMPCKHIFSILTYIEDVTWESLPESLRESPLHTLDKLVGTFLGEPEKVILEHEIEECHLPPDDSSLPLRPSFAKQVAASCREKLLLLRDMTYLCKEEEILRKMEKKILNTVEYIRQHLSNEEGLIPDAEPKLFERKRKSPQHRELPVIKKKKKMTRRGFRKVNLVNTKIDGYFKAPCSPSEQDTEMQSPVHSAPEVDSYKPKISPQKKEKAISFASQTFLSNNKKDTLLVELTSEKNVDVPKSKKVRYHVGGDVIEHDDFKCLVHPNWLNDKVINAYLHLLKRETNTEDHGHIFIMPSYVAVQWSVDSLAPWLFKKVKLVKFSWIFLPININQNHWILLAAYVPTMRVSLLDSLPGRDNSIYINKFREYMRCRSDATGELKDQWIHDTQLLSGKQSDGSSCGAFVMLNALALSRNILPTSLGQAHALAMRKYVLAKFLQSSLKPKSQRRLCDIVGCMKPKLPADWVACDVCGRWCHFKCVNVKSRPRGGYVCPICTAQYE